MSRDLSPVGSTVRWFILALLGVVGIWLVFHMTLNRDVGWWLHITEAWLGGDELYVDVWEINPPLMAYVASLPVGVAELTGISSIVTFRVYSVLVIGIAILLSGYTAGIGRHRIWLTPITAGLLVLTLLYLPLWEFGQREHLMFALVCPYLCLLGARLDGAAVDPKLAVLVGVMAGVGVGLKPYFVIPWVVVEAWAFTHGTLKPFWRRHENIAMGGFLVTYVLVVAIVHTEYFGFALQYRDLYSNFRSRSVGELFTIRYILPLAAAVIAVKWVPQSTNSRRLATLFLAFLVGALVAAIAQRKGWSYHFYPMDAAGVVVVGISTLGAYSRTGNDSRLIRRVTSIAASISILIIGITMHTGDWKGDPLLDAKINIVECKGKTKSLLVMSTQMSDAFPFVNYSGCKWSASVPFMWGIQAAYGRNAGPDGSVAVRRPDQMGAAERRFFNVVVEQFTKKLPAVLLVDTSRDPYMDGRVFPYLAYFKQSPGFSHGVEKYNNVGTCGPFAIYVLGAQAIDVDAMRSESACILNTSAS